VNIPKSHLLIADPDIDIRETLRLYFEGHGSTVQLAGLVGDVPRLARQSQPHVILVSVEFTDKDPYQVCHSLLDDTLTSHIPIIMLMPKHDRQARLEALEVGVSDIVTKPFDIEELALRINAAIRLATMQIRA
jgi:DNA-binding response OmpR family regulator